jgi:uncharacterized protein (TIGR03083 family)
MTTRTGTEIPASDPPTTDAMTIDEHIAVVAAEGQRFAAAARRGEMDADVPACPGWSLRDLVRHLAEIHLWAAANVAQRPGATLELEDRSELVRSWPDLAIFWPADNDLIDWYLDTNANLVRVLREAPSDVAALTFLPAPTPLAMWARRQAHETSIHRYDAEDTTGHATGYDATLAADGIDELLYGFYESVTRPRERGVLVDQDRLMHVHAEDTGDHWYVTIGPLSISASRDGGAADLTVTGSASDLYAALWNRGDDSAITTVGGPQLLKTWHQHTGIRWDLD